MKPKHPIQPLELDDRGVLRFKANQIVRDLLVHCSESGFEIATRDYTREDREQLAQLIGYSHSGAHDLGYMSEEVLVASRRAMETGTTEHEARAAALRDTLDSVRSRMRVVVAELYKTIPEDLEQGAIDE